MKNNTDLKITDAELIDKIINLIHQENISILPQFNGFANDLDTWSSEYWSIETLDFLDNEYVIVLHQGDEYLPTVQEFILIIDKIDLENENK